MDSSVLWILYDLSAIISFPAIIHKNQMRVKKKNLYLRIKKIKKKSFFFSNKVKLSLNEDKKEINYRNFFINIDNQY